MDDIRTIDDEGEIRAEDDEEIINPLEVQIRVQDEEKQQAQAAAAMQQVQAQQQAADPKNWTLEQTKEHFKENPPKTIEENIQSEAIIDGKKKQIKQGVDQLKSAPPPTLKEAIWNVISKPFVESPEERRAKAANIYSLSKIYDMDMRTVEKNYDSLAKGINRDPNLAEVIGGMAIAPIAAGVMLHPAGIAAGLLTTGAGLAAFQGISELENAIVSGIKKEKYQFLRGRDVKDLLPEETNQGTKDMVELFDFVGKGLATAKIMGLPNIIKQRFTKDLVKAYELPDTVYVKGDKLSQEAIKDIGLSKEEVAKIGEAKINEKEVEIGVPAERIVGLVNKGYWAKLTENMSIRPADKSVTIKPVQTPETAADLPKTVPEAVEAPIVEPRTPNPPLSPVGKNPGATGQAPVAPETPPPVALLPKELSGAKPRYSYGPKKFTLKFENDLDRAAYITAQKTPSQRDSDYLNFVKTNTSLSEAEVRVHGQKVRDYIKTQAKGLEDGKEISIPSLMNIPKINEPVLPVATELPPTEAVGSKERKFITTVKESEKTLPEVAKQVESQYEPISNKETLKQAQELIDTDYNAAIEMVEGPSRPTAFSNAVAIDLIRRAQGEGRVVDAVRLVERTAEKQTALGQAIQALSMYNRLSPEGILLMAQRTVTKAKEGIKNQGNVEKVAKIKDPVERDKMAKKLGIPHISEILAKELGEMAKRIEEMPEGRAKTLETALMLKKIADQVPASLGEKVAMVQTMAQLLNPKTFIRNFLGNLLFQTTENVADGFGAALDVAVSLRTGKRTVYSPNVPEQIKGFKQGAKEGLEEALLGVNTKTADASKFTLPQHGIFNTGVLGALEKTLRISLGATDRAFYQSSFNQSLRQQMEGAKLEGEPTAEMIEKAHMIGLYRTFQDDNVISNQFVNLKRWLNVNKSFGMGDVILKYPKTPGNILARGIEYSPFGFMKSVYKLAKPLTGEKFDQEGFVRSTSRAFTGTGLLVGTGAILAGLGIITGRRTADRDVQTAKETVGISDYQINVSALKRFAMSGMDPEQAKMQEDDTLVTYDWMQPASISLALGANMVLDPARNKVDLATNLGEKILEASQTLEDQPLVQGLRVFRSNKSLLEAVGEAGKGIPASFIPTMLNQIRQLTDNTVRNTKDPNYGKEMYNRVVAKIPGAAEQLPERLDTLGRPKEVFQLGSNNPFNVFLNPAFVTKYQPNPVSKMVLDIWESTGNTVQFPRVASAKMKLGYDTKEMLTLTPAQYTEFQKYIGTKTNTLFGMLAANDGFMTLPDDEKAKKLQGFLTDINTAAKIEVLDYQPKHVPKDVMTILKGIGEDMRTIEKQDDGVRTQDEDIRSESDD